MSQIRKKVNVVIGRFQPFTLGHLQMSKELLKQNDLPCVYIYVRSKSGKNSNISDGLTQNMMKEIVNKYSHIVDAITVQNSYLAIVLLELQRLGYEPVLYGAGPDRFEDYQKMLSKLKDIVLDEDFMIYPFKTRFFGVSGTAVREFIKDDDFNNFKKNMPACLHRMFKDFKDELLINESFDLDLFLGINENSEEKIEEKHIISTKIFHSKYKELTNILKDAEDKKELHVLISEFFKKRGIDIF